MNWADPQQYHYKSGSLFLGKALGQDIGIKTERHALTIAGAGAGKGAAVIIPNLLKWPHNALVIDPKGEAAEATAQARADMGQAVHVVDPFSSARVDEKFRASYNPLDEIDVDALTVREDIEAIADGIVMRPDASAAHWDDGAQSIISGLIAFVLSAREEGERNLIEVRKILANDDMFAEAMTLMQHMGSCAGLCREAHGAAFAKEGGYFVSNARKNTKWLDSRGMVDALATSTFSLADLKAGKASVFLVLPANYLGQHGRFLRLFVRCGIEAMARKVPSGELRKEQCLFLLDEFFSLGYIDEISKAAGLMRGYGLQLWPILQDLGQLITLYGREGSETFFANSDVHQFFGNTDPLTLEQISTRLGVTDMNEIPLPPPAPSNFQTGVGQGISNLSAKSERGTYKVMGGVLGGSMAMAGNAMQAKVQQRYQDQMNEYQRAMATHGRPRMTADQVAATIRKKDDVVADNMICFVFGREPLLLVPAPYFRDDKQVEAQENQELSLVDRLLRASFIVVVVTIGSSVLMTLIFNVVGYTLGVETFSETVLFALTIGIILAIVDTRYDLL